MRVSSSKTLLRWKGIRVMKLSDPINIMLDCCIPDKKKLFGELGKLAPGDTLKIEIDNCIASKAMVDSYLKHKWYQIVETLDHDDSTILHIRMTRET